jgi:hypothetical protein
LYMSEGSTLIQLLPIVENQLRQTQTVREGV